MKIALASLIILLAVSACGDFTAPAYWDLTPPDGPPEYRQGWADGCETARDANTNHFYKMFLTIRQDEKLVSNPVYYDAWKDAYNFCWLYQNSIHSNGWGNGK